jgi:Virulence-associated protein E
MQSQIDDTTVVRFLKIILPERGHYIAAIKHINANGFRPSEFAATVEELAAILAEYDRDGLECYFALASFKEPLNDPPGTPGSQKQFGRKKKNVLGVKAFWLDIDVRPDGKYKTDAAAITALHAFIQQHELPYPIIVSSGSGLHVYWPLDRTLTREEWEPYAQGLKQLCADHGLHADPARTADIASILRVPGTRNNKYVPPRAVQVDPAFLLQIEPYTLDRFKVFLDHTTTKKTTPTHRAAGRELPKSLTELLGEPPEHIRNRSPRRSLTALALAGLDELIERELDYPPSYGADILHHCAQLRECQEKRGCLPEPLWRANLGVLAYCEDGEELAHEISKGDERYSFEETQDKLEGWRQGASGPTTCKYFHDLNPAPCEACGHWGYIKSPSILGRRHEPKGAELQSSGAPAPRVLPHSWELTRGGAIKPKSYINTVIALERLGIRFRHNIFHDRKLVEGDVIENLGSELSDPACRAMRDLIITKLDFDPGIENVREAAEAACEANRFDPVCDYLDSLKWDGEPRLDHWLTKYLGAEDTPLNRAVGRKVLLAMVRRAREPSCEGVDQQGLRRRTTGLRALQGRPEAPVHLHRHHQQRRVPARRHRQQAVLAGTSRKDRPRRAQTRPRPAARRSGQGRRDR